MALERSVLIVDGSQENREVLEIALQRRGLRTLAAEHLGRGLELARRHAPDLIVLDLEIGDLAPEEVSAPFFRESAASGTPLVMLGTVRRRTNRPLEVTRLIGSGVGQSAAGRMNAATTNGMNAVTASGPSVPLAERGGEFVAKPYHYGPLIRKIEELLAAGRRENPRSKV